MERERPVPWSRAWGDASRAFWADAEPDEHFSTSAGPALADRMAQILRSTDVCLGHPDDLTVVDIGCGDGELLELMRERCPDLASRARWIGIDMRPFVRPGIDSLVGEWPDVVGPAFETESITGLVMAHELLDEIPCDVVERDDRGVLRLVLVDGYGDEQLGPPISDDAACAALGVDGGASRAWIARWWPLREAGDRAEVGVERDRAWQRITSLLERGTALATDYGHVRVERESTHRHGTLAAYQRGRLVTPVPDGSANLTAHVALDSCVDAVSGTVLSAQRDEVAVPPLPQKPSAIEVERHFAALRLRDPGRLGGVGWLRWDARH